VKEEGEIYQLQEAEITLSARMIVRMISRAYITRKAPMARS
jgi:hypothetical protein